MINVQYFFFRRLRRHRWNKYCTHIGVQKCCWRCQIHFEMHFLPFSAKNVFFVQILPKITFFSIFILENMKKGLFFCPLRRRRKKLAKICCSKLKLSAKIYPTIPPLIFKILPPSWRQIFNPPSWQLRLYTPPKKIRCPCEVTLSSLAAWACHIF